MASFIIAALTETAEVASASASSSWASFLGFAAANGTVLAASTVDAVSTLGSNSNSDPQSLGGFGGLAPRGQRPLDWCVSMWFAAATSVNPAAMSEYKDNEQIKKFLEQLVKIFVATFHSDFLRRLTYLDPRDPHMASQQARNNLMIANVQSLIRGLQVSTFQRDLLDLMLRYELFRYCPLVNVLRLPRREPIELQVPMEEKDISLDDMWGDDSIYEISDTEVDDYDDGSVLDHKHVADYDSPDVSSSDAGWASNVPNPYFHPAIGLPDRRNGVTYDIEDVFFLDDGFDDVDLEGDVKTELELSSSDIRRRINNTVHRVVHLVDEAKIHPQTFTQWYRIMLLNFRGRFTTALNRAVFLFGGSRVAAFFKSAGLVIIRGATWCFITIIGSGPLFGGGITQSLEYPIPRPAFDSNHKICYKMPADMDAKFVFEAKCTAPTFWYLSIEQYLTQLYPISPPSDLVDAIFNRTYEYGIMVVRYWDLVNPEEELVDSNRNVLRKVCDFWITPQSYNLTLIFMFALTFSRPFPKRLLITIVSKYKQQYFYMAKRPLVVKGSREYWAQWELQKSQKGWWYFYTSAKTQPLGTDIVTVLKNLRYVYNVEYVLAVLINMNAPANPFDGDFWKNVLLPDIIMSRQLTIYYENLKANVFRPLNGDDAFIASLFGETVPTKIVSKVNVIDSIRLAIQGDTLSNPTRKLMSVLQLKDLLRSVDENPKALSVDGWDTNMDYLDHVHLWTGYIATAVQCMVDLDVDILVGGSADKSFKFLFNYLETRIGTFAPYGIDQDLRVKSFTWFVSSMTGVFFTVVDRPNEWFVCVKIKDQWKMACIGKGENIYIGTLVNGVVDEWYEFLPCIELQGSSKAAVLAFGEDSVVDLPERGGYLVTGLKEAARWGMMYLIVCGTASLLVDGAVPPMPDFTPVVAFFGVAANEFVRLMWTSEEGRVSLAAIANYGIKLAPILGKGITVYGGKMATASKTLYDAMVANPRSSAMMIGLTGVSIEGYRTTGSITGLITGNGMYIAQMAKTSITIGAIVALLFTGAVVYNLPHGTRKELEYKTSQSTRLGMGVGLLALFMYATSTTAVKSKKRKTPDKGVK